MGPVHIVHLTQLPNGWLPVTQHGLAHFTQIKDDQKVNWHWWIHCIEIDSPLFRSHFHAAAEGAKQQQQQRKPSNLLPSVLVYMPRSARKMMIIGLGCHNRIFFLKEEKKRYLKKEGWRMTCLYRFVLNRWESDFNIKGAKIWDALQNIIALRRRRSPRGLFSFFLVKHINLYTKRALA